MKHGVLLSWLFCVLYISTTPNSGAQASSTTPESEKTPSSVTDRLNRQGINGSIQMLIMRRDRRNFANNTEPASGTIAATLNYFSPSYQGVNLGAQYVHAERFFNGGNTINPNGEGYDILNDDFSILNQLYVNYDFSHFGMENSYFRVGRQTMTLDFFQPYPIRQKEQAFEGILLRTQDIDKLEIHIGHIRKFSSWSPRTEENGGVLDNDFITISKVVGVPYDTDGMSFFSGTCTAIPNLAATVYDFYGRNLYNTFGTKLNYTLPQEQASTDFRVHWASQRDNGNHDHAAKGGPGKVHADALELAVQHKRDLAGGKFLIEPGYFKVFGAGAENNLRVPFRTSFVVDPLLMWFTDPFAGGARSIFLKSTYKIDKNLFYILYVHTDHRRPVRGGARDQEINFVYGRDFTEHWYASIKLGYGHRNNADGSRNTNQTDFRLFAGYKF